MMTKNSPASARPLPYPARLPKQSKSRLLAGISVQPQRNTNNHRGKRKDRGNNRSLKGAAPSAAQNLFPNCVYLCPPAVLIIYVAFGSGLVFQCGRNSINRMNAYLFSAAISCSQCREDPRFPGAGKSWQTWASLPTWILAAATAEEAQRRFETVLQPEANAENPVEARLVKISGAQFVEYLLTESGTAPLDLPQITKDAQAQLEATAVDDFAPGYWVDVEPVVRPDALSESVEVLQSAVAEDFRAGLNWAPDKNFLYVLTVFSPWTSEAGDAPDPDATPSEEGAGEEAGVPGAENLVEWYVTYPQIRAKEAAALIRARNSVVAAWLWRRYAAGTRLAANEIRIDPWCGVLPAA